jgi:hypothetical protein
MGSPNKVIELMDEAEKNIIEASISKRHEEPVESTQTQLLMWPDSLDNQAYYGLAGDIIKKIEPHTEADPAALLISFFVLFGNCIGRTAHFRAEADYHYLNLFACLVGSTSKGRKGVSFNQVKLLFQTIDLEWIKARITQGLSSGEGLIWAVRDEQRTKKTTKNGEEEIIAVDGIDDKRLVTVEQEFASTIRVLRREGNTLSAIVRKAWDDGNLNALTKNSPAKSTGAHISILTHITKDELLRYLDSTEYGNGFGNRFLWACVKRSKYLPEGGRLHEVDFADITKRLIAAVEFGRMTSEIKRDSEARKLWIDVYPDLSDGKQGLCGAMLARAEAQVMRIACIYAVLDLSPVVTVEHLKAALAVWDYCEASAMYIFGDSIGDPEADEIKIALQKAGLKGMTRTEISNHFGRNKQSHDINRVLNLLSARGLVYAEKDPGTGGRPVERWFINRPVTKETKETKEAY